MKNVIVVQLRRILQQTVRAATNISSVRRSLLLESSTWYVLDDARVRAFLSSLNTVTAYPTKRRLHRLHQNYLHTRSNRSIFARSRNKQISSICYLRLTPHRPSFGGRVYFVVPTRTIRRIYVARALSQTTGDEQIECSRRTTINRVFRLFRDERIVSGRIKGKSIETSMGD